MNKIINFIESEWSRPAIVCFVILLFFFFAWVLALAEKREAHRVQIQMQSWKENGYPRINWGRENLEKINKYYEVEH